MTKKHTFGEAVAAVRNGGYARLPHWNPGVWMFMYFPKEGDIFTKPFFCMRTTNDVFACEPTQTGILSDAWILSDKPE